jgi:hypothetical protein
MEDRRIVLCKDDMNRLVLNIQSTIDFEIDQDNKEFLERVLTKVEPTCMAETCKVYVVLGLSVDDAIQLDDWNGNGTKEFEKIYESLTDTERQSLADYIGEWMYDGDQWEEALMVGLRDLQREKVEAGKEAAA